MSATAPRTVARDNRGRSCYTTGAIPYVQGLLYKGRVGSDPRDGAATRVEFSPMTGHRETIKFVIHDSRGTTTVVPQLYDELSVGSEMDNRIRITGRHIAGHHARLFTRDGTSVVDSLSDDCPVMVNGHLVQGVELIRAGDRLAMGECMIEVVEGGVQGGVQRGVQRGVDRALPPPRTERVQLPPHGGGDDVGLAIGRAEGPPPGFASEPTTGSSGVGLGGSLGPPRGPASPHVRVPSPPPIHPVFLSMMLAAGAILTIKWVDHALDDAPPMSVQVPKPTAATAGDVFGGAPARTTTPATTPATTPKSVVNPPASVKPPSGVALAGERSGSTSALKQVRRAEESTAVKKASARAPAPASRVQRGARAASMGIASSPRGMKHRRRRGAGAAGAGSTGTGSAGRARAQSRGSGASPAEGKTGQSAFERASACLVKGDHPCVVRELAGKAREPQEFALLAETFLVLGRKDSARKVMRRYLKRFPGHRYARRFRSRLEREAGGETVD